MSQLKTLQRYSSSQAKCPDTAACSIYHNTITEYLTPYPRLSSLQPHGIKQLKAGGTTPASNQ